MQPEYRPGRGCGTDNENDGKRDRQLSSPSRHFRHVAMERTGLRRHHETSAGHQAFNPNKWLAAKLRPRTTNSMRRIFMQARRCMNMHAKTARATCAKAGRHPTVCAPFSDMPRKALTCRRLRATAPFGMSSQHHRKAFPAMPNGPLRPAIQTLPPHRQAPAVA